MLVRKYPLAFDQKIAYLWLSYDIPPILAVLNHILDHFVVVTFKFVVFLIVEKPEGLDAVVDREYSEVLVDLLEDLLDLKDLFDVYLDILRASWLVFSLLTARWLSRVIAFP